MLSSNLERRWTAYNSGSTASHTARSAAGYVDKYVPAWQRSMSLGSAEKGDRAELSETSDCTSSYRSSVWQPHHLRRRAYFVKMQTAESYEEHVTAGCDRAESTLVVLWLASLSKSGLVFGGFLQTGAHPEFCGGGTLKLYIIYAWF